jgi:hypothetical protein
VLYIFNVLLINIITIFICGTNLIFNYNNYQDGVQSEVIISKTSHDIPQL